MTRIPGQSRSPENLTRVFVGTDEAVSAADAAVWANTAARLSGELGAACLSFSPLHVDRAGSEGSAALLFDSDGRVIHCPAEKEAEVVGGGLGVVVRAEGDGEMAKNGSQLLARFDELFLKVWRIRRGDYPYEIGVKDLCDLDIEPMQSESLIRVLAVVSLDVLGIMSAVTCSVAKDGESRLAPGVRVDPVKLDAPEDRARAVRALTIELLAAKDGRDHKLHAEAIEEAASEVDRVAKDSNLVLVAVTANEESGDGGADLAPFYSACRDLEMLIQARERRDKLAGQIMDPVAARTSGQANWLKGHVINRPRHPEA